MHPREGWIERGVRLRRPAEERADEAERARRVLRDAARQAEPEGSGMSRRQFLRAAGAAGAGVGLGALLAACGSSSSGSPATTGGSSNSGNGGIPLPRPGNPVRWPVYSDNKAIASNLQPETNATLQIYNWVAYLNESVVKNFCKKYNCKYSLTTFNTMTEALSKLGSGEFQFDVFFPTIDVVGQLVETKMMRPLNHSYIPNMTNVWPDYLNPFYDEGWQYSTPYSIYTTGMAWRKDKVSLTPGWDMPWQAKQYAGKVAILDDYREGLALAMMRNGVFNLNTTDPAKIAAAGQALKDLSALTNVRIDNNDYTDVPDGKTWIHEAWSGDMATAASYMSKGTPVGVVGYWFPPNGQGPVANDLMVNLTSGKNPVLSHLFINYLLDPDNAIDNYSYVGYMQPLTAVTWQKLVAEGLLPLQLKSTVVTPSYFEKGVSELQLPLATNALYEQAWNSFSQGL